MLPVVMVALAKESADWFRPDMEWVSKTSCVLKEKRESGAEISRANLQKMPAMQLEPKTKAP